jgi:hypothetical protein
MVPSLAARAASRSIVDQFREYPSLSSYQRLGIGFQLVQLSLHEMVSFLSNGLDLFDLLFVHALESIVQFCLLRHR